VERLALNLLFEIDRALSKAWRGEVKGSLSGAGLGSTEKDPNTTISHGAEAALPGRSPPKEVQVSFVVVLEASFPVPPGKG
jgi:hypothetical protein